MLRESAEGMNPDEKQSVLSCMNPIWSGVAAYRTLISSEKLRARCPDHRVLREFTQVSLVPIELHTINSERRFHSQYMGKDAVRLSNYGTL
jgi:hypothetical protein